MRVCLGLAILTCATPPSDAQEPGPTASASNQLRWSGLYIGAYAGGMYIDSDQYSPAQLTFGGYSAGTYGGDHFLGGLQAGYDLQFGNLLLGVGLDLGFVSSGKDSFLKVDEVIATQTRFLSTFTGRVGYLLSPAMLVYARGGLALARMRYTSVDERWNLVADDVDETRVGYTLGVGSEMLLANNWTIFAEFQYMRFNDDTSTFDYGEQSYPTRWTYDYDHTLKMATMGIRYRF